MAKDVQNQQLAEWLQQLGCPVELSPEDLQLLNNGRMRSVWRHLQTHVKPVSTVRKIKKNLLLAKLRANGVHHTNFKIETVQELIQLQNHSVTQREIDVVKDKIKEVDESLLSASNSLATKVTEKERMMQNLEELNTKSALLNLKLSCVQSDVQELDKELEIASVLKTPSATKTAYLDMKENKQIVAKFVQQFSSVEITDDNIHEMIVSSSELPPSLIFDEILSLSNNALKALRYSKIAGNRLLSNGPNKLNHLSFSKHLTDLNTTLFKIELEHQSCARKMAAHKTEFEKEKAVLCKVIEEAVLSGNGQDLTLVELVDKILETTLTVKREEKLKEFSDELQDVCSSDYNHAKWMVESCKEKEDRLLTEVNKKLSDINNLIEKISTIQVSSVKFGVLHRVKDLVTQYLNPKKNHQDEECPCQVIVSENLIGKEIEMFQKLPLVAMTRQWEDSFETIPMNVREDILKDTELLNFLCQSESKNLIKNIVEKKFWLHASSQESSD